MAGRISLALANSVLAQNFGQLTAKHWQRQFLNFIPLTDNFRHTLHSFAKCLQLY